MSAPVRRQPAFRFQPPTFNRQLLRRPRLDGALDERFDRRVTLVVAGPGFGKTALLSQSLADRAEDPHATDVWLGLGPADADRATLVDGLVTALNAAADRDSADREPEDREPEDDLASVSRAVWRLAPAEVCLCLDDVHELDDGSDGMALIVELADDLPDNGHLVLAGRTTPEKVVAAVDPDRVTLVDEADLAFTTDELSSFADVRAVDTDAIDDVGGWPALAELRAETGLGASDTDFLAEEVLGSLPEAQRRAVIRLAPFEVIDPELATAVAGPGVPIDEVLARLPMVTVSEQGVTFHDLWRPVLVRQLQDLQMTTDEPDWYRPVLAMLRSRGDYVAATAALDHFDDPEELAAVVDDIAQDVSPHLSREDCQFILGRLDADTASTGAGALVQANMLRTIDTPGCVRALRTAVDRFREEGDLDGAARALNRQLGLDLSMADRESSALTLAAMQDLAEQGVPRAVRSITLATAYAALIAGDPEQAIAMVEDHGLRDDAELTLLARHLIGTASLELGDPVTALDEGEAILDQLHGELRMAVLGLIAEARTMLGLNDDAERERDLRSLLAEARRYGYPDGLGQVLAGYSLVKAMQGDLSGARELLAEADGLGDKGPRSVESLGMSRAVVALLDGDEEEATAIAAETVEAIPFGTRPDRSYLRVMDLLYICVPSTRPVLDALETSTMYDEFRSVARMVVDLRTDGENPAVLELDWDDPNRLRTVLLEPFIAEVAAAAHLAGRRSAHHVFESFRLDPRPMLERVAERYDGALAEAAPRPADAGTRQAPPSGPHPGARAVVGRTGRAAEPLRAPGT